MEVEDVNIASSKTTLEQEPLESPSATPGLYLCQLEDERGEELQVSGRKSKERWTTV